MSFFLLCLFLCCTSAQVVPSSFITPAKVVSVNGSSATGHCSNVTTGVGGDRTLSRCNEPTSSVLFYGNVPTLTGLDGDMWASQLLTLQTTGSSLDIIFDFSGTPGFTHVIRVEVVMFNCPEWGIGTQTIQVQPGKKGQASSLNYPIHNTSCASLVRLSLPVSTTLSEITLHFFFGFNWVHLAEVTFYDDVNTAPTHTQGPITTMPTDTPPITVATTLDYDLTSTPNTDTTSDITISSPAPANSSPTGMTTTVISTTFPTSPSSPTGTDTTITSNSPTAGNISSSPTGITTNVSTNTPAPANNSQTGVTTTDTPGNISSSPTGITTLLDHDLTSMPNTDATSADTTTSSPAPADSSSSAGIIAGVIVVVILIAVAIVVVIGILVCLRRKQQKQGKAKLDSTQTTAGNGLGLGTLQKETDVELTGQGACEAIDEMETKVGKRKIANDGFGDHKNTGGSVHEDPDQLPAGKGKGNIPGTYEDMDEETGQVTQEDTYDVLREHDRQGTMDSGAQQTYSRLEVSNRPGVASEASDPMYSTVAAKPGRERTATSPTDVYAVVDKKKKQPKPPKPYQTDLYAVVSKPAAPPVPIKSPALTDYLESNSVPEDSPDRESSSKAATLTRSMDTEPERMPEDVRHTDL